MTTGRKVLVVDIAKLSAAAIATKMNLAIGALTLKKNVDFKETVATDKHIFMFYEQL
jgi:hypothetical protein